MQPGRIQLNIPQQHLRTISLHYTIPIYHTPMDLFVTPFSIQGVFDTPTEAALDGGDGGGSCIVA